MFHIDALTGNAVACSRSLCPVAPHFETAATARAHYEHIMDEYLFSTISSKPVVGALSSGDLKADWSAFLASAGAHTPAEDLSMFEPF